MLLSRKDDLSLYFQGKLNFYHGLAISLLLHLSLVLPFLLITLHTFDQSKHEKLRIELFGMISDRQMEERHKGSESPQQANMAAQQANNIVARQSADKYQTVAADSPVHVEKADESVPGAMMPVSGASSPAYSSTADAVVEQRQQMINNNSQSDPAAILKYSFRVSERIRANLVYPQEAQENGVAGVTKIAFVITSSGNIRENSLRVVESSGSTALDFNALRAARASAPFEKPPAENVEVVIPLTFKRDS